MTVTPRLAAPYILQSQSQKEVTHNEALNILDGLVQGVAEDNTQTAPPASPAEGAVWIVGAGATGDWAGHDDALAQFIGGTWAFHTPLEGWSVWLKAQGLTARYDGTGWVAGVVAASSVEIAGDQVLGARQAAIADATGGATIDAEARAALNALLGACRTHGLIES
jgi:hypothetical protein